MIKELPMYRVECDMCGEGDDSDFYAWMDREQALTEWRDGGDVATEDGFAVCRGCIPVSRPDTPDRPGSMADLQRSLNRPPRPRRYDQCDDTCTVDCGHCKGAGRPVEPVSSSADGEAVETRRCGERISGLYGAETVCQRIAGHSLPHTPNDGIWLNDAVAEQFERELVERRTRAEVTAAAALRSVVPPRVWVNTDGSASPVEPATAEAVETPTVWCHCYGTPEPDGPWVHPDDWHADVCSHPVVSSSVRDTPVPARVDGETDEVERLRARIGSALTWIDRYESKNGGLMIILAQIKESLTGARCVDATPGATSSERFAAGEQELPS